MPWGGGGGISVTERRKECAKIWKGRDTTTFVLGFEEAIHEKEERQCGFLRGVAKTPTQLSVISGKWFSSLRWGGKKGGEPIM